MVPMIMLALPAFSRAEHPADDFSWLDDMIINQLKALDAGIHKRLPAETALLRKHPPKQEIFLRTKSNS